MLASLSCAISLIMPGGIAGGILDAVAFSRTPVFSLSEKYKWAGSPTVLLGYFALIIAVGILTTADTYNISLRRSVPDSL